MQPQLISDLCLADLAEVRSEAEERQRIMQTVTWDQVLDAWQWRYKRRAGGALVIQCPFHHDQTPSGFCYPRGYYHCYGCQVDCDRVQFVRLLVSGNVLEPPLTEDFLFDFLARYGAVPSQQLKLPLLRSLELAHKD
jgi:hypothetical protein